MLPTDPAIHRYPVAQKGLYSPTMCRRCRALLSLTGFARIIDRRHSPSAVLVCPQTLLGAGAFLCAAGPNRFKITQHRLSYGDFLMQKWELTYEIIGSAVAIGALLVLLWHLGFVS